MEPRLLIKNLSAKKSGLTEEFPVARFQELTIGRDPSCDVQFDPNDDLVSRRHAKISQSAPDSSEYTIADLGSRNGTFVNKQRIFGPVKLNCGDHVQLGADGPDFIFDIDPPPAGMLKPTRLADAPILEPTREASPMPSPPAPMSPPMSSGIGKATVERMIADTKKQSRNATYIVAGLLLLIVVAAAVVLYLMRPRPVATTSGALTPTQIAQANTDATVMFEAGWKLVDTETGKQLFHVVIPNKRQVEQPPQQQQQQQQQEQQQPPQQSGAPGDQQQPPPPQQQQQQPEEQAKEEEIVPGAGEVLPVFLVADNQLEPLLTTDPGSGKNQPIGGRHSGSGFVVSTDGFILTNRHVAAAWHTRYGFPARVGIVLSPGEGGQVKAMPIPAERFPPWVPSQAKLVTEKSLDLGTLRQVPQIVPKGKTLEGRNDYLDVTFAKNRIRIPAKLARTSDRVDVAMVKIDLPQSLKRVELNDNYDSIKVGDSVVCLGYPGVSPAILGVVASRDVFNQQMSVKEIPDPTLSTGNIGRLLRGQAGLTEAQVFGGDIYQLTINSTGSGNSGGPVFDDRGRVIAIFDLSITKDVTITGAIPIRYGFELMGVQPAAR